MRLSDILPIQRVVVDSNGSKVPNKDKVGKVTRKQVLEIAKLKVKDMNSNSEEAAFRVISGTARSMGIDVVG